MSSVCQLFYVSRAAEACHSVAIQDILQMARRNNRKLDITGCLLYSGRHFAQVLEGDERQVLPLARRIADDPRHTHLQVLMESRRADREYGEWSMGYLHDLALEDQLTALFQSQSRDPGLVAELMSRMKPDSVMGALR
jgi:hypothetical protein